MQMLMSLNWFQLFLAIVGAIMIPFIFKRIFFKAPKKKALSMKEYMKNHGLNELDAKFQVAIDFVSTFAGKSIKNEQRLTLYAFFKQAKFGPCNITKPSAADLVGRAKWESWQALGQMDSEVAKKQYIDYVKDLFKGFDPTTAVASNGSSPSSSKSRSKELQDGSLLESMAGAVSTMQIDTSGEEWKIKEDVFHYASTGSLDQIKAALSKGIDVNIQDEEGRTMLHWAVDRSQKELVKFLVHEHGAQLNIQDVDGMTCLHYAVSCEDEELTKLLVDANALVDVPDQDGETPLDLASDTIKQILIRKS